MNKTPLYNTFALGDSAITIDFGNTIDPIINQKVINLFQHLQQNPIRGMIEAVPAYSSLTIYYDILILKKIVANKNSVFDWVTKEIKVLLQSESVSLPGKSRLMKIPVCFEKEFAPDLEWIAEQKNISPSEIISIFTGKKYRVYMLGFIPGFAYMGEVDSRIEVPRKLQPRQLVEAGSVGIAGKQTGIYPLPSPGGWQIIGHTPVKLFEAFPNPSKKGNFQTNDSLYEPTLLKAGDEVQFYSINKEELVQLQQ